MTTARASGTPDHANDPLSPASLRDALRLLHSIEALAGHPLAHLGAVRVWRTRQHYPDTPTGHGMAVHDLLHQAVARLRPNDAEANPGDRRWWPYLIIQRQYLRRTTPEALAQGLNLSRATFYREQQAALEALAVSLSQFVRELAGRDETTHANSTHLASWSSRVPQPYLHNLPAPPTPFVGRTAELQQIAAYLDDPTCRLLTLTGLGGVGKTRLAIEAAHAQLTIFADGIFFMAASARDEPPNEPRERISVLAAELLAALQQALWGSSAVQGEPRAALCDFLRAKHALIVLDNFELHVDSASLLVDMLAAAPQLKLLVTSRERLAVHGEWSLDIDGLPVPRSSDLSTAQHSDAIHLFVQCARRVQPGFRLTPDNLPDVVAICRLVDGLPLGIELAAAWSRAYTCREIRQQIEADLRFLTSTRRDIPARQRSIQAILDYSWRSLTDLEQGLFARLAIFRGGFTSAAATAVAEAVPGALASLVDKALLRHTPEGRYHLHPLLHQYAADRATPAIWRWVGEKHASYYTTFLHDRATNHGGAVMIEALTDISIEFDNVRAAWHWAARHGRVTHMTQGARGLAEYCLYRGLIKEGAMLLNVAITALRSCSPTVSDVPVTSEHSQATSHESSPIVRNTLVLLLAYQAEFLNLQADHLRAAAAAAEAVALCDAEREPGLAAHAHVHWGATYGRQGQYDQANMHLEQALVLARRAQARDTEAVTLRYLGKVASLRGQYGEAERFVSEALKLHRKLQDWWGEAYALSSLGTIQLERGAHDAAREFYEAALALYHRIGDLRGEGNTLYNLGMTELFQGYFDQARANLETSLKIHHQTGNHLGEANTLLGVGTFWRIVGGYDEAESCFNQVLDTCERNADRAGIGEVLKDLSLVQLGRGNYDSAQRLSRQAFEIAVDSGRQMIQAQAQLSLGHALAATGAWLEAHHAYHRSWELRQDLAQPHLAIDPLAGLARVALGQGDAANALVIVKQIQHDLVGHTVDMLEDPLRVLFTCYLVLNANQDPHAAEVLATAHALLQKCLTQLADEALRWSLLNCVETNRAIMQAANTGAESKE